MHPLHTALYLSLRRADLRAEAEHARLVRAVGTRRTPALGERLAARRTRLGYLLVEAGLRLVVTGRPPPGERPARRRATLPG